MAMERQRALMASFKRTVAAGDPDIGLLWAANSCTSAEADEARREERVRVARDRADEQRRMRHDAWADAAGRGAMT